MKNFDEVLHFFFLSSFSFHTECNLSKLLGLHMIVRERTQPLENLCFIPTTCRSMTSGKAFGTPEDTYTINALSFSAAFTCVVLRDAVRLHLGAELWLSAIK